MTDNLKFMIVSDGLLSSDGGFAPHPELQPWHKCLTRTSKLWADCAPKTPLEWYLWATKYKCSPAALLASRTEKIPADTEQCWVASPYQAVVARDHVHVAPESALELTEKDVLRLADLLNPLLEPCGMVLMPVGPMLFVCCDKAWDVDMPGFASISGGRLPNRLPQGVDGGDMMRLLSEIQMVLAQESDIPVSGLWFWGASDWPVGDLPESLPAVMTDDPALSSIANADQPSFAITSVAGVEDILNGIKLPRFWLLAGDGQCVLLDCRALPRLGKNVWKPGQTVSLDKIQERVLVE